jgi:hypothetical protein
MNFMANVIKIRLYTLELKHADIKKEIIVCTCVLLCTLSVNELRCSHLYVTQLYLTETLHVSTTKTNWLLLFNVNHTKYIHT